MHVTSSRRARVAACRRMKDSTPTDGPKTILRRESAQRYGKCNLAKDSPDKALTSWLHSSVSSVSECCVGLRTTRWKRVPQKGKQGSDSSEDVIIPSARSWFM